MQIDIICGRYEFSKKSHFPPHIAIWNDVIWRVDVLDHQVWNIRSFFEFLKKSLFSHYPMFGYRSNETIDEKNQIQFIDEMVSLWMKRKKW